MPEVKPGEELLRVEHLCQYFGRTKAVDDVSFSVYKGEVFGLVGESGCGKTTTGRSIIKIYDITSGDIYLEGKRVAAGVMSYKRAISDARKKMKTASAEEKAKLKEEIAKNREEIKKALQVQKKEKVVDKVQMIFQDPIASLDPRMTVREIIGEGLIIRGEKDKKVIDERVYEALEKVGLVREHAGRYPHEFSGGQRQRIGIA
ncbi:MAG: ATP-binding cassette domain-containing protein, partial [Lachnospiraceae bacterium]|nr:ATP-binding cassette domain-containing protein [Lachnospiraceae bacterium]